MTLDMRSFLQDYEAAYPEDVIHINKEVNLNQEVTAITLKFEKQGKYPVLVFHKIVKADGNIAEFPLITNIFASRTRRARLCRSTFENVSRDIYRATHNDRRKPVVIDEKDAPVKEVVKTGDQIDLFELPAIIHHDMDVGQYFSAGFITTYDPDTGIDNSAIQRCWVKDKDTIRTAIAPKPAHNGWNLSKYEQKNEPMKAVCWVGHHPLVYIGGLAKLSYPESHWDAIGGMLGEPFRLVPSETLGKDFMVPANAEIVVEGIFEPHKRYPEAPFGEFIGYYGPQVLMPQWKVTAITYRKNAIWQSINVGHEDNLGLGVDPFEGLVWEQLSQRFHSLRKVYMPTSGVGRYHVYLQFKDPRPGEARQAINYTWGIRDEFIKHVFAFDDDIDIYDPRDVMWAIATRSQWDRDLMVLSNIKSIRADPSIIYPDIGAMGGLDCTKPPGIPHEERNAVNPEVLSKINLEDFVSSKDLSNVRTENI